jgi:hypothetical protein
MILSHCTNSISLLTVQMEMTRNNATHPAPFDLIELPLFSAADVNTSSSIFPMLLSVNFCLYSVSTT